MRRLVLTLVTATALVAGTQTAWAVGDDTPVDPSVSGSTAAPSTLLGGDQNVATDGITPAERDTATETLDDVEALLQGDAPASSGTKSAGDATIPLRDLSLQLAALPRLDRHSAYAQFQRPYFDGEPGVKDACSGIVCLHWRSASSSVTQSRTSLKTDATDDTWATSTVLPVLAGISSAYSKAGYRRPKADAARTDLFPVGTDGAQVERYLYDDQGNPVTNPNGTPKLNPEWAASGYQTATRPVWGANSNVDVYLADLGGTGAYGYCAYDLNDSGRLVYPTAHGDVPAFCVLDNDYSLKQFRGYPGETPTDILKVTAAHEYFHAVQFAYDALEDSWFMEATATWAERQLFPAIPDNRQYLPYSPLRFPTTSIDTWDGNGGFLQYGDWIFFEYLTQRFPTRTGAIPNLVRVMWEYADSLRADQYSIQAVSSALATRGATLPRVFASFSAANLRPAATYRGGAAYPASSPRRNVFAKAGRKKSGAARIDHLASSTVRFRPKAIRKRSHKATITVDLAKRSLGTAAIATVRFRDGHSSVRWIKLSRKGNGKVRVPFSSGRVAWVDLTLVNANQSFSSCSNDRWGYSCGGTPRHDNLLSRWTLRS